MKVWLLLCLLFGAMGSQAQTTKVLIVGDSWAAQQWEDGTHDAVFFVNGYPQFLSFGDEVSISGSTAAEWVAPAELQKITDALNANPDIDTVQLTLGGNDFLDQWNTGLTPMAVTAIQNQIIADLQVVVDHILAHDIGIEVILSFYDYPNFVDTTSGFTGIICANLHNDLGTPTPTELNSMEVIFEQAFASVAASHPKVFHVSHTGLMQNLYGFPDDGIPAGTIQPPGDVSLPSPVESMRITFGVTDCFHLRPEGYDVLVQNLFDQYFQYRFDTIYKSLFE
mgnify:CR=1 FL=1